MVSDTLNVVYSVMLAMEYPSQDEYQSIGRVIDSIIHAIGPEMQATSKIMKRCSAIANQMKVTFYENS